MVRLTIALLLAGSALPQQYVIAPVAGGAPPPTPAAALTASIGEPQSVMADSAGNLYFTSWNCVFKLDSTGTLARVAGNSRPGFRGDGDFATGAQLNNPAGLAPDAAGNLYVADYANNRVRKIAPNGVISTFAGTGVSGYSGDGGPATSAQLNGPSSVAVDSAGNLYIADTSNSRIRIVSSSGIITTVAGNGTSGYSGDGGPATNASLGYPVAIALDAGGSLYVADLTNSRVRKVAGGTITTVAGTGAAGYSGDGGLAIRANLNAPSGVGMDSAGNLYIADTGNARIRKVSAGGTITTVAGNGTAGFSGDGGLASAARLNNVGGVAADSAGNFYVADSGNARVRKVSSGGTITTVAGNGNDGYSGDLGLGTAAQLSSPQGVALDANHNLYIASSGAIRKVTPAGTISTLAGTGIAGYSGDGGPAGSAQVDPNGGIVVDSSGNVYFTDASRIRMVSAGGTITTIAGGSQSGFSGDNGPAAAAGLNGPVGLALDSAGDLFIADTNNNRIRKISTAGTITTVAGNGAPCNGISPCFSGDGGPGTAAQLNLPYGVAIDRSGNLLIADTYNSRIRKLSGGTITTVAGSSTDGFAGDGGLATSARLEGPSAIAVDLAGNLYIADTCNARIRRVSSGVINTIAGDGTPVSSGDNLLATTAQLAQPWALTVDNGGVVYEAEREGNVVRLLQPFGGSPFLLSVTNGASNLPGPIAPGEIVVIKGAGLGPAQLQSYQLNSSGGIDTQAGGTRVLFNLTEAPVIYAWAWQVAAIVPYSLSGSNVQVAVSFDGSDSPPISVPLASSAPGIFTLDSTGFAAGAVLNQNYSVNTPGNPAKVGEYISIFATGEGQTTPAGVDGKVASPTVPPYPPRPILPVTVTIGGKIVTPVYAGGAPGSVAGLLQINAQIPSGIQTGSAVPVTIQIGNATSPQGVTIAVQ